MPGDAHILRLSKPIRQSGDVSCDAPPRRGTAIPSHSTRTFRPGPPRRPLAGSVLRDGTHALADIQREAAQSVARQQVALHKLQVRGSGKRVTAMMQVAANYSPSSTLKKSCQVRADKAPCTRNKCGLHCCHKGSYSRASARCAEVTECDLPNRLLRTFQPASTEPGFHVIKVQVAKERPQLSVVARMIYWIDGPNTNQ
jgi:hypothetical protein